MNEFSGRAGALHRTGLSSEVGSWSFLHSKKLNQTIEVTGSANKRIKSDFIIWRASVTVESPSLAEGDDKFSRDVEKARACLVAQGVPTNQIVISAVVTTPIRIRRRDLQDAQVRRARVTHMAARAFGNFSRRISTR